MTLYRCFAWNARATASEPDGPLWFPRAFQGDGRHDNPDLYGCLYLAEQPVSSVAEQLFSRPQIGHGASGRARNGTGRAMGGARVSCG